MLLASTKLKHTHTHTHMFCSCVTGLLFVSYSG